ncbi:hypothetical protein ACHQM5_011930 [Ranunculus cassubicifolius]
MNSIKEDRPFVIFRDTNDQNQAFCPLDGSNNNVTNLPKMPGMRCAASCYGWLMMHSLYTDKECYLLNPVTLREIQLPALPRDTFTVGVLTYPPSDPKCVVMFFSEEENMCVFCRVGDKTWIKQAVTDEYIDIFLKGFSVAVSIKGKIYLFFDDQMIVIDVQDNFACIEPYQLPSPECFVLSQSSLLTYFLESRGEIFQVYELRLGKSLTVWQFAVFKLDFSKMAWARVESLGDRIFLLGDASYSGSVLSAAEYGAKGNCIYSFSTQRTELYCFDMEDGTITSTQPCPTRIRNAGGLFWVVPDCKVQMNMEATEDTGEMQLRDGILPPELIQMIFQYMYLGGGIRFRLASKAFISMTPPVRSFHPQILSDSQHLPWLISLPNSNTTNKMCHFHHPIYTDVYTMNLPQVTGAILRHAKFGWWLMSLGRISLFFFNPLTLEIIKLPEQNNGFISISFSSPPTSSGCVVFGLKYASKNCVEFSAYHKLQSHWSPYILTDLTYTFEPSQCNPVYYNGVFYCLAKDGKLGVFNPNETSEEDMWRVYTSLAVRDASAMYSTRSFIMESNGDIFSVFVGFVGIPVRVYKLDQSKNMKWFRVRSLEDRVMFLSHTTSLLIPAVLEGTENKIYFPRFKKNASVFYSLRSGKYGNFGDQNSRPNWIGTCEHWNCTWFQATN